MTLPDLIIFDVDGTLIDSQAQILASMEAAFAAVGRAMPQRAEALSVVGLSLPLALMALAPGATAEEGAAMAGAYRAAFRRLRLAGEVHAPLFPGTRAMLDGLAGRATLGLATGKSRRGLDHLLALHGLAGHFATVQVADDHPSKPHPAMLLAALAETGVAAGRAVMVGDTEFDVEMGRAAGLFTVAVDWGYHGRDRLARADAVIAAWDELLPALAALERAA